MELIAKSCNEEQEKLVVSLGDTKRNIVIHADKLPQALAAIEQQIDILSKQAICARSLTIDVEAELLELNTEFVNVPGTASYTATTPHAKRQLTLLAGKAARLLARFTARLPVFAFAEQLPSAILNHHAVVLQAETGSGKSTQVAAILADELLSIPTVTDGACYLVAPRQGQGQSDPLPVAPLCRHFRSPRGCVRGAACRNRHDTSAPVQRATSEDAAGAPNRVRRLVVVTQPRRLAARSLAERVASEWGCALGEEVGFDCGGEQALGPKTIVKFVTDRILLEESMRDPMLSRYRVVILDEAHERSIDTDLLLGRVKLVLQQESDLWDADGRPASSPRDGLRAVVMSATLNADLFAQFFTLSVGGRTRAPAVLEIPGRAFPVSIAYTDDGIPLSGPGAYDLHNAGAQAPFVMLAAQAAVRVHRDPAATGDVIVFLPALEHVEAAAKLCAQELRKCGHLVTMPNNDRDHPGGFPAQPAAMAALILTLHGALDSSQQRNVFQPCPQHTRKIVFSTVVGETSVTIDGLQWVIDAGLAKDFRFDPARNMTITEVGPAPLSSIVQRAGRAGRTAPGSCIRLFSALDCNLLSATKLPEIQRMSATSTVLKVLRAGVSDPRAFPFIEAPSEIAMKEALAILEHLGGICTQGAGWAVTDVGEVMAVLPVDPMASKLLVGALLRGVGEDGITMAAAATMSAQIPWVLRSARPQQPGMQGGPQHTPAQTPFSEEALMKARARLSVPGGELTTAVFIYREYKTLPQARRRDWCKSCGIKEKYLLSLESIRKDIVSSLSAAVRFLRPGPVRVAAEAHFRRPGAPSVADIDTDETLPEAESQPRSFEAFVLPRLLEAAAVAFSINACRSNGSIALGFTVCRTGMVGHPRTATPLEALPDGTADVPVVVFASASGAVGRADQLEGVTVVPRQALLRALDPDALARIGGIEALLPVRFVSFAVACPSALVDYLASVPLQVQLTQTSVSLEFDATAQCIRCSCDEKTRATATALLESDIASARRVLALRCELVPLNGGKSRGVRAVVGPGAVVHDILSAQDTNMVVLSGFPPSLDIARALACVTSAALGVEPYFVSLANDASGVESRGYALFRTAEDARTAVTAMGPRAARLAATSDGVRDKHAAASGCGVRLKWELFVPPPQQCDWIVCFTDMKHAHASMNCMTGARLQVRLRAEILGQPHATGDVMVKIMQAPTTLNARTLIGMLRHEGCTGILWASRMRFDPPELTLVPPSKRADMVQQLYLSYLSSIGCAALDMGLPGFVRVVPDPFVWNDNGSFFYGTYTASCALEFVCPRDAQAALQRLQADKRLPGMDHVLFEMDHRQVALLPLSVWKHTSKDFWKRLREVAGVFAQSCEPVYKLSSTDGDTAVLLLDALDPGIPASVRSALSTHLDGVELVVAGGDEWLQTSEGKAALRSAVTGKSLSFLASKGKTRLYGSAQDIQEITVELSSLVTMLQDERRRKGAKQQLEARHDTKVVLMEPHIAYECLRRYVSFADLGRAFALRIQMLPELGRNFARKLRVEGDVGAIQALEALVEEIADHAEQSLRVAAEEETHLASQPVTCSVCMDDFSLDSIEDTMRMAACACVVHRPCAAQWQTVQVDDPEAGGRPLACQCGTLLCVQDVHVLLGSAAQRRIEQGIDTFVAMHQTRWQLCPSVQSTDSAGSQRCRMVFEPSTPDRTWPAVTCCGCGETYCSSCQRPAHAAGMSCAAARAGGGDTDPLAGLDPQRFKKCPKCGVLVERIEACAHMVCSVCRADFQMG